MIHPGENLVHLWRTLGIDAAVRSRVERRCERRYPFPHLMELTPLTETLETSGDAGRVIIVGKHLSRLGLDFYHRQPLPFRRGIVSIERSAKPLVHILMDLGWCRFLRAGWYTSGGRFIRLVDPSELAHHRRDAGGEGRLHG